MKLADVHVGATYAAKVSGKLVKVKILRDRGEHDVWFSVVGPPKRKHKGWDALNLDTQRTIHVKTAARLRLLPDIQVRILADAKRAAEQLRVARKAWLRVFGGGDAEIH